MARGRRMTQEINAGSMADIAFLLLVFFLVTTTIDTDYGVQRRLPPPQLEDVDPPKFKQRNVFVVLANANDQLLVEGELLDITELRDKAKEFILNPNNSEDLPEKTLVNKAIAKEKIAEWTGSDDPMAADNLKKWKKRLAAAEVIGEYSVTKQVISLQNDRGTSYNLYIQVQNELAAAYHELRDDFAEDKFGMTFNELKDQAKRNLDMKAKYDAVKTILSQKISEAEPVNIGSK